MSASSFGLGGLLFLLAYGPACLAGESPQALYLAKEKKGTEPRLLELESGQPVLLKQVGPLLPRRVYAVYIRKDKSWVLVLTDEKGRLPNPFEVLLPGSVLPSQQLGIRTSYGYFELRADYRWAPSVKMTEFYLTSNLSPPLKVRRTSFITPLVNPDIIDPNLKRP